MLLNAFLSSNPDHRLQNGRKIIAKLEERLRALESELDHEQRRHSEASKNLRKADRRIKELFFQVSSRVDAMVLLVAGRTQRWMMSTLTYVPSGKDEKADLFLV